MIPHHDLIPKVYSLAKMHYMFGMNVIHKLCRNSRLIFKGKLSPKFMQKEEDNDNN